jgi:hypothetical protein
LTGAIVAVALVATFVISTALLALMLSNVSVVPRPIHSFLRAVANGQEPVSQGNRALAYVIFGVLSAAIIVVQSIDLGAGLRSGNANATFVSSGELVLEAGWLAYLWSRRRM